MILVRVHTLHNFFSIPFPPLSVPLLLFLSAILFSLTHAVHPSIVLQFLFWQILLFCFYWITSLLRDDQEREPIFLAIALSTILAGFYGAFQRFGFDFVAWETQWNHRPFSTFGNPNFAAGWWMLTLPLLLTRCLNPNQKWNRRCLYGIGSLLSLLNLYWSATRGAWLAAGLSLTLGTAFWFFGESRRKKDFKSLAVTQTLLIVSVFFALGFWWWIRADWRGDRSLQERIFKWKTALSIVHDNPLMGVGAGNLKTHFALYQAKTKEGMDLQLKSTSESNVHNDYLQIGTEIGLFGLGAYLSIFAAWFFYFLRQDITWNTIGPGMALLGFLIYSLSNFPFQHAPSAALLFFLLGNIPNKTPSPIPNPGQRPRKPHPLLWIGAWILALLFFSNLILKPLYAERLRFQASFSEKEGDLQKAISQYTRAIELDYSRSEKTAYQLGECYRKTGDLHRAIHAYQISTHLRNYGEVYNNIGNCYYLLQEKKLAKENWEIAARLGLPDPKAQEQLQTNLKILQETGKGAR
ncbi:MAG: O-antigen ligase family protein [Elusimicrobia bacterium]|nr:O-antigen ligase family protein [Elusimicrobiota bacterium]